MGIRQVDAVLPLRRHDYERFTILDRSLRRNLRDLTQGWVVTTDAEHGELRSMIDEDLYRVIPESSVIPEIEPYRALHRFLHGTGLGSLLGGRWNASGWFVQQLVKIAIAQLVEADFYLTLDSDVICMKPAGYDDLVVDSRALTHTRTEDDVHPDWYADAERLLGARRSGVTYGVTPAVLSRQGVLALHAFLDTRVGRTARRLGTSFPRGSRQRDLFASWRSHLGRCRRSPCRHRRRSLRDGRS